MTSKEERVYRDNWYKKHENNPTNTKEQVKKLHELYLKNKPVFK